MTDHGPGPLWVLIDRSYEVDYRWMRLVSMKTDKPDLAETGPVEPQWVTTGLGWIALMSGGNGHNPTIVLEAWETEPPVQERTWKDFAQLQVSFESDTLRIWGTASGPSLGPRFVLPPADSLDYEVRIYRDGGTETETVNDLAIAAVDDEGAENGTFGLEDWLFQFWPRS